MRVMRAFIFLLIIMAGIFPADEAHAFWPFDNTHAPDRYFEGTALEVGKAIKKGDIKQIQALAPSVDLNLVGKKGMTLLFFAAYEKKFEVVSALIKLGADPRQETEGLGSVLDVALAAKELRLLKALLEAGVSANSRSKHGTPILFFAVSNLEALKLLIEKGADINAKNGLGETTIFEAINHADYDTVEYLISNGADIRTTNVNGISFAYSLQYEYDRAACNPTTENYKQLSHLKELVQQKGLNFPVDLPPAVKLRNKNNPGLADPCHKGQINSYTW